VVILLAVVPVIVGDDKPAAAPTIRGKWEVSAATFNGTAFTGPKDRILEFGEDEVTMFDGRAPTRSVSYTLDATTGPKHIDLDSGADDKKALGIYALNKDELRICYAEPGAGRPARFESKPGDRVFLLVLKRVKE
jgi:uncharacterized protein (TIGR03067 family)